MSFLKATLILSLSAVSAVAFSQGVAFTAVNQTVSNVDAQGNSYYYFMVSDNIEAQCLYSSIYISIDKKALYGQVLAAKLSGKRLSRIDCRLSNGPNSECVVDIVEIE
ncbi:hypothetical protein [Janthinobacterium sp.]|uniref:hypothetical protein n=1 Tax=Janthinobacterium sp. TaxID=1871054 RepID=UPI002603A5EF|nr:hypothetical protein [Janthinobacterium sp.]